MKDLPILFQDDMVAAILDGRKTVTRRTSDRWARVQPGTLLWVRECWGFTDAWTPRTMGIDFRVDPKNDTKHIPLAAVYRTGYPDVPAHSKPARWRPSIHMPRWASRLTLRVIDVRREETLDERTGALLPNVDDGEARREGVADRAAYLALWSAINGPAMPAFVYRVAFEVCRG